MRVEIETIDQKLRLNGSSELVTYLSLRLPNGELISARVDSDVAQTIINLVSDDGYSQTTETYVPESEQDKPAQLMGDVRIEPEPVEEIFGGDMEEGKEEEALITWRELPETSLPAQMKTELEKAGVPEQLNVSDLVELTDAIAEQLMAKARKPPQRQGVVQRVQSPPIKTVPKDEMGYPRVSNVDRDPGEIAQMGTDEDGIPQL